MLTSLMRHLMVSVTLLLSIVTSYTLAFTSPTPTTTAASDVGSYFFTSWPWWWWIPVAGGSSIIAIIVIACCICCCCRCRQRKKRQLQRSGSQAEAGCKAEDAEMQQMEHSKDFKRNNSSAAKRYLLNVVSVFSWGSDFGGDYTVYDASKNDGGKHNNDRASCTSQHDYMNPEDLNIVPPTRPPKQGQRKSGIHYLNVTRSGSPALPVKRN